MLNANFYVECDASHVTFDINCRSNRSFALNSNAQSVFDIVRPFNILGVECDVKRFHIAFDTPKTPFYLPNPRLFPLSNFVIFDFSPDLSNLIEFQQTPCGTLALVTGNFTTCPCRDSNLGSG